MQIWRWDSWDVIGIWDKVFIVVKNCAEKVHSAQLVGIANSLGDPPFGLVHRLSALSFSNFKLCNFGLCTLEHLARSRPFGNSPNWFGDPQAFFSLFFQLSCSFLLHSFHALSLTPNT
ncbi:hypothetical protein H5410_045944 [Solanum commersonii]|uniref:Uncharacterized protein n=1 Tax=Solanum commersonii TaxID=4109 RepID=A0A9J5XE83_SOLCO|nr:hypothetical protein H5410_045944 [Solanum commersonii]